MPPVDAGGGRGLDRIVPQLFQLAFVLGLSPLVKGCIATAKARFQGRRGPPLLQPYFDLAKLLRKEDLVPTGASWLWRVAPLVYFAAPLVVTLLIPVLTDFPLYFAFTGDMLAGGFVLTLGGFFLVLAALDPSSPYGGVGSSRSRLVSLLAEPVLITVIFTVALTAHATVPYVVQKVLVRPAYLFYPSHLLILLALFMVILAETGHIPVDNPDSLHELSMIDEARALEYTGPRLALLRWGGAMKLTVLLVILMNVLTTPWGLTGAAGPFSLLAAAGAVLAKLLLAALALVLVEVSGAKIRLFRVPEFLGAAFGVALLAALARVFGTY